MKWVKSEKPAGSFFMESEKCSARVRPIMTMGIKNWEWSIWVGSEGKRVLHMAHETVYLSTAKYMAKQQLQLMISAREPITVEISPIEFIGKITMVYPARNNKPAIVVLLTNKKQVTVLRVPDLQNFEKGMQVKITVEQIP